MSFFYKAFCVRCGRLTLHLVSNESSKSHTKYLYGK